MPTLYIDGKFKITQTNDTITLHLDDQKLLVGKLNSHEKSITIAIPEKSLPCSTADQALAIRCLSQGLQKKFHGWNLRIICDANLAEIFNKEGFATDSSQSQVHWTTPSALLTRNSNHSWHSHFKLRQIGIAENLEGNDAPKADDQKSIPQDAYQLGLYENDTLAASCRVTTIGKDHEGNAWGALSAIVVNPENFRGRGKSINDSKAIAEGTALLFSAAAVHSLQKNYTKLLVTVPTGQEEQYQQNFSCKNPALDPTSTMILCRTNPPKQVEKISKQNELNWTRTALFVSVAVTAAFGIFRGLSSSSKAGSANTNTPSAPRLNLS